MLRNGPIAPKFAGLACAIVITSVAPDRAAHAGEEDFYKGKQLRLVVSTDPGVYDTFGRLLARFLPAHLPGSHDCRTEHARCERNQATNYLQQCPRAMHRDRGVHNGIPTAPFEEPKQALFDVNKLS
jgi:hypothetical protein